MSKTKLSVASGKHRKYKCECGAVVSRQLPLNPGRSRCSQCGEILYGQPFTVEDLSVRRRDEAEGSK
jgi:predicted SprT family Zn-dependent metalloprotease